MREGGLPQEPQTSSSSISIGEAFKRAEAAFQDGRLHESEGICRDILAVSPSNAAAFGLWGATAARQGNLEQAIQLFERALAIAPDNLAWLSNLLEFYRLVYRLNEARSIGERALQLDPKNPANFVRLAKTLVDMDQLDEALRYYLAANALDPDDASAHLGIAQVLLSRGEFRPGLIEYEWRNKLPQAQGTIPRVKAPVWNGMSLPTGRVLLIADQGAGDTLQFARYIPQVADRCLEVVLACAADVEPLLARIPGVGRTFHSWEEAPRFTAYALLSSLPYILGTELHSIPAQTPYLVADPEKAAHWSARLGTASNSAALRVGLYWSGSVTHPNNRRRSMRLSDLAPLMPIAGVQLVSLQKIVPVWDEPALCGLIHVGSELASFDDTAAVIQALDLVISVDSAVAHLTGALGKPIWMMNPRPSDWRWLLDRDDSPWYPTMRLFRQPKPGAWASVVENIRAALALLAVSKTTV